VRHEEQDVNQEAQKADEEVGETHEEHDQEVSRRMGRTVKMRNHAENEPDKGQESSNWVDDEES